MKVLFTCSTVRNRHAAGARHRRGGILVWVLVAVGLGAAAYTAGLFDMVLPSDGPAPILGADVRRGPLRISEVVRGNLEAKDSIVLKSEIQGRSTIIYLAEEGTLVKEGDLVAELDVSQLQDELVRQEIEVKNAEASYTKAKEQYDIQVIQNLSDIAEAELAFELAQLDLAKYTGIATGQGASEGDDSIRESGEWDNELASAEENVLLRQEDLERAERDLGWSEKLFNEQFIPENEFEADKLATKRAGIQLDQAKRELQLMVKFGNRRQLAELEANVATRERDIEKTRKQAAARLTDFEAARESAKYTLDRERQQLAEQRGQVEKSKIFAPQEGLLVYARERSRWGGGDTVEEGDEVRERQDIASIPRAGGMTVQASIHETKLKKVRVGQPCLVTIDAFPDKLFEGSVDFVAVMADSGSWRSNPNQRLYKADIALTNPTRDMRPGMSASVEILVEDLDDVHYVPRQCVLLDGTDTIVFRVANKSTGRLERVSVKVGLDNTKWVAIEEGLAVGDVVALSPPADFQPKDADDEDSGPNYKFPDAKGGANGGGKPSGKPGGKPSGRRGGGGEAAAGSRPGGDGSAGRGKRGGKKSGRPEGAGRPAGAGAKADAAKASAPDGKPTAAAGNPGQ